MSTNYDNRSVLPKADMHNERGITLAERGWLVEAIKEFKKAIVLDPDSSQGYDNLANAYSETGDFLGALSAYTKAIELDPDNPFALHNLGIFLSNHAQKLSYNLFKKALNIEPEFFESRFHLGLCLAKDEKHIEAVQEFLHALEDAPYDNEIRFELALSYIELNKEREAISEILIVTKAESNHEDAWYYLALCYHRKGFIDEAYRAINKSLSIEPSSVESILLLSSIMAQKKCLKEAKLLIKKANRIDATFTKAYIECCEYLKQAL